MRRGSPRALVCFVRGLGQSLSKPYLAVALWLIQLMLAAALILPIGNTLHAMLDRSPAGEKMVAVPDYGWWETARRTHPDVLDASLAVEPVRPFPGRRRSSPEASSPDT